MGCMQADRRLDNEEGEACSGQKAHLLHALQAQMNSVTVKPVLQAVICHLQIVLKAISVQEHLSTASQYQACMQSGLQWLAVYMGCWHAWLLHVKCHLLCARVCVLLFVWDNCIAARST